MRRASVLLLLLALGCSDSDGEGGEHAHHGHGGHGGHGPDDVAFEQTDETRAMVRRLVALQQGRGAGRAAFGNLGKLEKYEQGPIPEAIGDRVDHYANHGNVLLSIGRSAEALEKFELALSELRKRPEAFRPGAELRLMRFVAISHLRIGEQKNCQDDHNPDSCLLPIAGGGVHRDRTGSEAAVDAFLRVLEVDPGHQVSRWLLNVAAMTLGEHPDRVPEEHRIAQIGRAHV